MTVSFYPSPFGSQEQSEEITYRGMVLLASPISFYPRHSKDRMELTRRERFGWWLPLIASVTSLRSYLESARLTRRERLRVVFG